jgi:hypothetical protein
MVWIPTMEVLCCGQRVTGAGLSPPLIEKGRHVRQAVCQAVYGQTAQVV